MLKNCKKYSQFCFDMIILISKFATKIYDYQFSFNVTI